MPESRDPELKGARIAFEELPLIDIKPLTGGGKAARPVIDQLGWAARNTGFFYVTAHRISQTLIDDTLELSREFFGLPLEEKMRWHYSNGRNHSDWCVTWVSCSSTGPTASLSPPGTGSSTIQDAIATLCPHF